MLDIFHTRTDFNRLSEVFLLNDGIKWVACYCRNLGWNVIILVSGLAVFIFLFFVFVGPWVGGLDSFQNTCTALPSLHSPIQKPPTQSCCHATCPPSPSLILSRVVPSRHWCTERDEVGRKGCRWVVGAYLEIQSTSWKWKNGKEWTICLVAQYPPPPPQAI